MALAVAKHKALAPFLVAAPALIAGGYYAVRRAGFWILYRRVEFPEEQIVRDIPYHAESQDEKHRLDLYLPKGTNWPILIFIHGGGLNAGDKRLRVCGADIYGNIGRFYASRGIGVAVINYRLQPRVTWREQVDDVARAAAWVYSCAGIYGANPSQLFIGGHSAGAHLATRVALDSRPLARFGLSPSIFSGVIAVSGAAFDLSDARTYELGHKQCHYAMRFRCGDPTDAWQKEASPINCAAPGAPPFLIIYAAGETQSLQRQSQLLHERLQSHAVPSRLVIVPGQNHCRMVLTLSRPDRLSASAVLTFMGEMLNRPLTMDRSAEDLISCADAA
jgi:acetyl esterase/lipase